MNDSINLVIKNYNKKLDEEYLFANFISSF